MALGPGNRVEIIRRIIPSSWGLRYGPAGRDRWKSHRNRSSLINSESWTISPPKATVPLPGLHQPLQRNPIHILRRRHFISVTAENAGRPSKKSMTYPTYRYKSSACFNTSSVEFRRSPSAYRPARVLISMALSVLVQPADSTRFPVQLSPPSPQLCPKTAGSTSARSGCYPAIIVYHILYLIRWYSAHFLSLPAPGTNRKQPGFPLQLSDRNLFSGSTAQQSGHPEFAQHPLRYAFPAHSQTQQALETPETGLPPESDR